MSTSGIILSIMMGLLGLLGLLVASRATDGMFLFLGFAMFAFGVLMIFRQIASDPPSRKGN